MTEVGYEFAGRRFETEVHHLGESWQSLHPRLQIHGQQGSHFRSIIRGKRAKRQRGKKAQRQKGKRTKGKEEADQLITGERCPEMGAVVRAHWGALGAGC